LLFSGTFHGEKLGSVYSSMDEGIFLTGTEGDFANRSGKPPKRKAGRLVFF